MSNNTQLRQPLTQEQWHSLSAEQKTQYRNKLLPFMSQPNQIVKGHCPTGIAEGARQYKNINLSFLDTASKSISSFLRAQDAAGIRPGQFNPEGNFASLLEKIVDGAMTQSLETALSKAKRGHELSTSEAKHVEKALTQFSGFAKHIASVVEHIETEKRILAGHLPGVEATLVAKQLETDKRQLFMFLHGLEPLILELQRDFAKCTDSLGKDSEVVHAHLEKQKELAIASHLGELNGFKPSTYWTTVGDHRKELSQRYNDPKLLESYHQQAVDKYNISLLKGGAKVNV